MLNSKDIFRKVVGTGAMFTVAIIGGSACVAQDNHVNRGRQEQIGLVFDAAVKSKECKVDIAASESSIILPDDRLVARSNIFGGDPDFGLYDKPMKEDGGRAKLAYVSDDYSRYVDTEGILSDDKDGEVFKQEGVKDVADSATKEIIAALAACAQKES